MTVGRCQPEKSHRLRSNQAFPSEVLSLCWPLNLLFDLNMALYCLIIIKCTLRSDYREKKVEIPLGKIKVIFDFTIF